MVRSDFPMPTIFERFETELVFLRSSSACPAILPEVLLGVLCLNEAVRFA